MAIEHRFVCQVTLGIENDNECDIIIMNNENQNQTHSNNRLFEAMTGQRSKTGNVLNDPDTNKYGLFFLFPDLSIRDTGKFKIRCTLVDIWYLYAH